MVFEQVFRANTQLSVSVEEFEKCAVLSPKKPPANFAAAECGKWVCYSCSRCVEWCSWANIAACGCDSRSLVTLQDGDAAVVLTQLFQLGSKLWSGG
jgi:hypothetical protein